MFLFVCQKEKARHKYMSIESRLNDLEEIVAHRGNGGDEMQKEFLLQLIKIREGCKKDDELIKKLQEDAEKTRKEIAMLKNEIEKRDNRIYFLKNYVDELEAEKAKK